MADLRYLLTEQEISISRMREFINQPHILHAFGIEGQVNQICMVVDNIGQVYFLYPDTNKTYYNAEAHVSLPFQRDHIQKTETIAKVLKSHLSEGRRMGLRDAPIAVAHAKYELEVMIIAEALGLQDAKVSETMF